VRHADAIIDQTIVIQFMAATADRSSGRPRRARGA